MSTDSPEPSEESKPLPKATVPVELAPRPAEPSAAAGSDPEPAPPEEQAPEPLAVEVPEKRGGFANWVRSLSVFEKSCCGLILLAVIVFAATVFVPALFDFPKDESLVEAGDLPVAGEHLEVLNAEVFWRKAAEDAATEMHVFPVLQLNFSGKGIARVLFRDSDGKVTGDPVTIENMADGEIELPAASTAGLKTSADYAAYRAEELSSWSVEVHEAPVGSEDASDFTLLFKMSIPATLK